METQEQERARVAALFRAHGMVQPSERVWREGIDVTHEHPATWPVPWSWYTAGKRGAEERDFWLRQHAEAVAGQAALDASD